MADPATRPSIAEIERALMLDVPPTAPFALEDREVPTWDGKKTTVKAFRQYNKTWRDAYIKLVATFGKSHDRDAFVYSDMEQKQEERLTWPQFFGWVGAVSRALVEKYNVKVGDKIGVASRNCTEWFMVWWACHVVGACCVQLNAFLNGPELEWCTRFTECRIVFADDDRLEALRPYDAALRAEGVQHLILYRRDPRRAITEKNPEGYGHWKGVDLWQDFLKGQDVTDPTIPDSTVTENDLALFLFSSGTTGRPKAIPSTHFNWGQQMALFDVLGARSALRNGLPLPPNYPNHDKFLAPPVVVLQATPLFHLGGIGACLGAIMNGGKVVMMYRWNPAEALYLIEKERCTNTLLIPTMAQQALIHPDRKKRDLSSLVGIAMGGMVVNPDLVSKTREDLAPNSLAANSYGASECLGITSNGPPDFQERPDSVGPPFLPVQIRIWDSETGEDITDLHGQRTGDIMVRGPQVAAGYWKNPEANQKTWINGWYNTGDVGYITKDGFLYLSDRSKDMVIRGGENIAPAAVESAINSHPAVMQCAVFGVPDTVFGEELAAIVTIKPEFSAKDVTPQAIRAHLRPLLARFQIPAMIEITTTPLPVGTTFKTAKRQLRDEFIARLKAAGDQDVIRAKL
ncbi:hypothetical protein DFJ74DRAFT_247180 [Hyaloraphidium curvatum]|nr:hypothetical protein DFJ74DRAFT_247180 [Hyaloraphidium curvatum]